MVNFYLMAFNLLPLPPLDGGRIVTMLLPYEAAVKFSEIERYGLVLLVGIIFSRLFTFFIHPFVLTARELLKLVLFLEFF